MARLDELPLWLLPLLMAAVGAVGGGLLAAIDCLVTAARGRRT